MPVKIASLLNRGRTVHYLEIFAAAAIVYALGNYKHMLGAHGVAGAGPLAYAAAAVGIKAVLEAWRKATRPPSRVVSVSWPATVSPSATSGGSMYIPPANTNVPATVPIVPPPVPEQPVAPPEQPPAA